MAASIRSIRESFAWFGYPLDDLTDEEIEEGVMRVSASMASMGVTAEEAAAGLRQLFNGSPTGYANEG